MIGGRRKRLTRDQVDAVYRLWERSPDGARSYLEFRRRVNEPYGIRDYAYIEWCNMYVGIEADGYTHT